LLGKKEGTPSRGKKTKKNVYYLVFGNQSFKYEGKGILSEIGVTGMLKRGKLGRGPSRKEGGCNNESVSLKG